MIYFKLLILSISLSLTFSQEPNCNLCADHTMCLYHDVGKKCEGSNIFGVTEEQKNQIVEMHNHFRNFVATGQETRGSGSGQPSASNMLQMFWDNSLAEVAQRWADQCTFEHDTCRKDMRWEVGQNIHLSRAYENQTANWTAALTSWYDEVAFFNPEKITNFQLKAETDNYTQMLWHNTNLVGCGMRGFGENILYVCNYGPAGNIPDKPMYNIGQPCQECPKESVCKNNLCAMPQQMKRRYFRNMKIPKNLEISPNTTVPEIITDLLSFLQDSSQELTKKQLRDKLKAFRNQQRKRHIHAPQSKRLKEQ